VARFFLFLIAISVGVTLAILGSRPDTNQHVLLLSSESISEHSVICNGFLIDDGLVLTAAHCLDGTKAIALGGHSYCTMDGWQIINDIEVTDKGDELGQITWNESQVQQDKSIRPQVGPVEIIGHGPNNGDGGLQCERQKLSTFSYDNQPCNARPKWESELAICLSSASQRVCPGWSGSAVMQEGNIIGIVSGGTTCNRPSDEGILVARSIN